MGSDDDQSYVPSTQEEDSDGDSIMTDPKTKKPDAVNLLNETGCLPSGKQSGSAKKIGTFCFEGPSFHPGGEGN